MFNYNPQGGRSRYIDSGPGNFARSTLGAPPKAALMGGQDLIGQPGHWAGYGQPWTPKRDKKGKLDMGFVIDSALGGVPEAESILEQFGIGRFQAKSMGAEALRQLFGVETK